MASRASQGAVLGDSGSPVWVGGPGGALRAAQVVRLPSGLSVMGWHWRGFGGPDRRGEQPTAAQAVRALWISWSALDGGGRLQGGERPRSVPRGCSCQGPPGWWWSPQAHPVSCPQMATPTAGSPRRGAAAGAPAPSTASCAASALSATDDRPRRETQGREHGLKVREGTDSGLVIAAAGISADGGGSTGTGSGGGGRRRRSRSVGPSRRRRWRGRSWPALPPGSQRARRGRRGRCAGVAR